MADREQKNRPSISAGPALRREAYGCDRQRRRLDLLDLFDAGNEVAEQVFDA